MPTFVTYPRVLVINGEPFWQGSATGLTMTNLFKDWPSENLACLYISDTIPDPIYCKHYWKLSNRDLRNFHIFFHQGRSLSEIKTPIQGNNHFAKLSNQGISHAIKWVRYKLAGQALTQLDSYKIPPDIQKQIEAYQPQIIYSMLGCNTLLNLVNDLSDYLKIPVLPHFMDDWPITLYQFSLFRQRLRRIMVRNLDKVLKQSPVRLVIGNAMAEEYNHRYGGDFIPFMNVVEPKQIKSPASPSMPRRAVRLIYIGGLHLNRWRSLHDIGMALKSLHAGGLEVEALIYSQVRFFEEGKKLNIFPVMQFVGEVNPAKIFDILCNADILLHVESFDKEIVSLTRYSISTKIPECMFASRPIFAYGPKELASIQYVQESGAGIAVTSQQQDQIIEALRKLILSSSLRESLGKTGYRVALMRHDALKKREEFREIISRVAVDNFYKLGSY